MKTYQATLSHDKGKSRLTVKAETIETARMMICKAENCPPSAVELRCKILQSDPETVYLEWFNDYLTVERMAEHYNVQRGALYKVISKGRLINHGRATA